MATCNLMMNQSLRTVLDLLRPNITNEVNNKQAYLRNFHMIKVLMLGNCAGLEVIEVETLNGLMVQ